MEWNKREVFSTLVKVFLGLFALSFSFIILNVIFNRSVYSYLSVALVFLGFLIFLGLVSLKKKILKKENFCHKHYYKILFSGIGFLFLLQIVFAVVLRYTPTFDLEAVYNGGIAWAESGSFEDYSSSTCHSDYFYIFPNNLGTLSIFALLFKICGFLGITDYFIAAAVFNALLFSISVFFSCQIARKLFGTCNGVFLLILFLVTLPFYFIAPVFYTDSLSLLFPVAAFYLILKGKEVKIWWQKILLHTVSAIFIGIGALVKMTVLVVAIAVCIFFFVTKKFKHLIAFALISVTVISLIFGTFNGYIYSHRLDKEKAEEMNTPVYYWIDLAFHGNGGYNNDIFYLSRYTADPKERKEVLKEDIKAGIEEKGVYGVLQLFTNKSARAFGDGTFALSDFLDDNPEKFNILHKFLLYEGDFYGFYSTVCTSLFLCVLALMIISVKKAKEKPEILVMLLSVFGIMLFLLFWEINSRYITTFVPFIYILAAGTEAKYDKLRRFS